MTETEPPPEKAPTYNSRRTAVLLLAAAGLLGVLVYLLLLPEAPPTPPAPAELSPAGKTLRRAQQMLRDNQTALARDLLENYVGQHPQDTAVRPLLAEVLLHDGKLDKARDVADRTLQLQPSNPGALWVRGLLAEKAGQDPEEYFAQAAAQPSAGPRIWAGYGRRLLDRNQPGPARTYLLKAHEAGVNDPMVALMLGQLAFSDNRMAEAARFFQEVLAARPDNWFTWVRLGEVQRHLGRLEESVLSFGRALQLAPPQQKPIVHAQLARTLASRREFAQAARHYLAAAEHPPAAPDALYEAARCLYLAGRYDLALACLGRSENAGTLRGGPERIEDLRENIQAAQASAARLNNRKRPQSLLDVPAEESSAPPARQVPASRPAEPTGPPSLLPGFQ